MGWKSEKYTSTTAITAPASFFYVSGCAGGSGGGGGDPTPGGGGGGGCAGQATNMYPLFCVTGETLTITIGAGGAGGAVSANGGAGGNSSVVGGTSGASLTLYAGFGGLKGNGTAGGNGGVWIGGSGLTGGAGGANGVAGVNSGPNLLSGGTYQLPFSPCVAKFGSGAGGGGLNASGGIGLSSKNGIAGNAYGGGGNASGGGGGGGGGTPWGTGGTGGSNGAAGAAPAAWQYGGGGGGGSGNSAGGAGSPGGLWLVWFDDADLLNILTSTLTLAGSIGKLIADNLNATISSRSTYGGSDTAGTTTLLTRVVGTLASGTHQPQSGDAYARLGSPSGASVAADLAAIDAAVSGLHDFDPATDTVAHVTLVDTVTTLTNSPDVPTESEIAAQVRINLAPELASITAMEERLEEQVPTGPVVVIPAPPPGQTAAWTLCLDPSGQPDPGARVYLQMTTAGSGTGVALDPGMLEGIADADGIATVLIPRRAGPQYQVWRGQGARVTVTGVDAETLPLPILMGSP